MSKQLLSLQSIVVNSVRGKHIYSWKYPNIRNFEGVKYCPRDEELDKPEERIENPAKLFRVQRIKPLKGRPFWEKKILAELGIADVKRSNMTIVKNIPEMNNRLMKIKHLIRIDPITFPYGEPTRNDVNHTYLTPTGECIVTKDISIDPKRIEATDKFINDPTRLDKDTLSNDALKKWNDPFI